MTKYLLSLSAALGLLCVAALPSFSDAQTEEKVLTGLELKGLIAGLGYEPKDLGTEPGKEKFEFRTEKDGFEIWIAAEVSASKRFVWLSAFLGASNKIPDFTGRAARLLEQNTRIQPSQFHVGDAGNLYLALSLDNRNVTPAVLKWRIDKLAADVASTVDVWRP